MTETEVIETPVVAETEVVAPLVKSLLFNT